MYACVRELILCGVVCVTCAWVHMCSESVWRLRTELCDCGVVCGLNSAHDEGEIVRSV